MTHDSAPSTRKHILQVRHFLDQFRSALFIRGTVHDQSKLEEPEKSVFDEFTHKLSHTEYASPQYKQFTSEMRPALEHHYANNSHHPEHYEERIAGMDLLDIVEMLCDWKAATERTRNGDIRKSIEYNAKRWDLDPQLVAILRNTVERLHW